MSSMDMALSFRKHVILYVGLSKGDAWEACALARQHGAQVSYYNDEVTGSNGKLRHYTVVAYGLTKVKLESLWKEVNR
jgi:hypothetical protein